MAGTEVPNGKWVGAEPPQWAVGIGGGGGADIVEPPVQYTEIGWTSDTIPPNEFFNWWQNQTYNWVVTLDEVHRSVWANRSYVSHVPFGVEPDADQSRVSAKAPPAMAVEGKAGNVVVDGRRYGVVANSTIPVAAAHATLLRYDRVTIRKSAYPSTAAFFQYIQGVAATTPFPPAVPAGDARAAIIRVAPAVTQINAADVTDDRERDAVGTAVMAKHGTQFDRLTVAAPLIRTGLPAVVADIATIDLGVTYPDGAPYDGDFTPGAITIETTTTTDPNVVQATGGTLFEVELFKVLSDPLPAGYLVGAGTIYRPFTEPTDSVILLPGTNTAMRGGATGAYTERGGIFEITASTGTIRIERQSGAVTGTFLVMVRPLNRPGAAFAFTTFTFV